MNKLLLALPAALLLAACSPPAAPPAETPSSSPAPATDEAAPAATDAAPAAADAAATAEPAPAAGEATAAASADGAAVYNKACVACHGAGLAGAPKLGDGADWGPRIAQGQDVLVDHVIKGFTGKKGVMPPRGGFMNLSDDEVRAAVAHMVSQSGG